MEVVLNEQDVLLVVEDTGKGISEAKLNKILNVFIKTKIIITIRKVVLVLAFPL